MASEALVQRQGERGVKTNHSPPFSTVVENEWIYKSTPPYAFIACPEITLPF